MSTFKSRMRSAVEKQNTPSHSENATMNRAGGVAFEIDDPATKLVTMTGGSFFAEPKYYEGDLAAARVTVADGTNAAHDRFKSLQRRLKVTQDKLEWLDTSGVDEVTSEVLATAAAIAEGAEPEDLLAIARWLRHDMHIRATPQALLVLASRMNNTKPYVRKYAPTIVVRPDEVKTCMLMHRFFFGMKTMKNCLAQGLSDAMSQFGEKALLKYDSSGWPTWKDVLQVLPRGTGRPLPKAMADYFLKGEVTDPNATPIIAARKKLAQCDSFDTKAQELAAESMVNWEVLSSQFSHDEESKREVWQYLVSNELLGYMAMLRNLRNILEAGVNRDTVYEVCQLVADRDHVLNSKQLPFRFISAAKAVQSAGLADAADVSQVLTAIGEASNVAAEAMHLPGSTAIFVDASASMSGNPVSEKSTVDCAQAAAAMAAIVAKACERPYLYEFATDVRGVRFSKADSVVSICDKFSCSGVNGHGTEAWKIPSVLMSAGLTPDRVIVLSDMQCWNQCAVGSFWGIPESAPLCDEWCRYRKSSKDASASKTWLHCIHLNGYGDTPIDEEQRVNQVGGFSEKVFGMLLEAEGRVKADASEDAKPVPTMDQIRKDWLLS